ncbi:hypothetical protein I546_6439 [Mycobacterium kansasii 732]|nr:hypothetical protein I546_6439 [Mycobacterium kansasii 732]
MKVTFAPNNQTGRPHSVVTRHVDCLSAVAVPPIPRSA